MAALLLFGLYPQAYYPQLSINATCVPGAEIGVVDSAGNRFTDTRHIEGTLSDMLDGALSFVRKNMRVATKIDTITGERVDIPQYPMDAVREAILNALIHRDYSFHTEGMPIQLIMYTDRMELINPGGLYGRLTIDQLGNVQPDTRNPVLVTAMEALGKTENRYSGIPTIRRAMKKLSLPEPLFIDSRGSFIVTLFNKTVTQAKEDKPTVEDEKGLLAFCRVARSRAEILEYLAIPSGQYALRRYLDPLVNAKLILMTIPDKPRSPNQKFYTAENA